MPSFSLHCRFRHFFSVMQLTRRCSMLYKPTHIHTRKSNKNCLVVKTSLYLYIYIIIIIKYIVCTKKGRKSERCVCSIKRGRQRVYILHLVMISRFSVFFRKPPPVVMCHVPVLIEKSSTVYFGGGLEEKRKKNLSIIAASTGLNTTCCYRS